MVVALALSGCAGGAGGGSSASCLPFSTTRAASILGDGSRLTVDGAGAVKSTEHQKAYYVAIRFSGPGVDKQVGVWATNDLDAGQVFSVDAFAEQFSGFPTIDGFSSTDAGAEAARGCV